MGERKTLIQLWVVFCLALHQSGCSAGPKQTSDFPSHSHPNRPSTLTDSHRSSLFLLNIYFIYKIIYINNRLLPTWHAWGMLWISSQRLPKAVEVLSGETVGLPTAGQHSLESPCLPLSLPTATVTLYLRPPNKSQLISPNTKEQITAVLSFWYHIHLHIRLQLLHTNLLILHNVDFPRGLIC